MIFVYILLVIIVIFIIIIYLSNNISYLPKFVPNEVIKQGETINIAEFIKIKDEINEYNSLIMDLNNKISEIEKEILKSENNINIQLSTIETLKDELKKIEEALDQQEHVINRKLFLDKTVKPFYALKIIDYNYKNYAYSTLKTDFMRLIYLMKLYNTILSYK